MTRTLEKGHDIFATRVDVIKAELDTAVARLSQAVPGAREPEAPPGLVNEQIQYLQTAVSGIAARMQMTEGKSDVFEAAITDVQRKVALISSAGAGRTVGAQDPWQPQPAGAMPTATSAPCTSTYGTGWNCAHPPPRAAPSGPSPPAAST